MSTHDSPTPSADLEVMDAEITTALVGVDTDTAAALRKDFTSFFAKAIEWKKEAAGIVISDATEVSLMKKARNLRLEVRSVRCTVENHRKALKEGIVAKGRAIDGLANLLKGVLEPIEEHLLEQEKYAERKEAERIAGLQAERAKALSEFNAIIPPDLGTMSQASFDSILADAKLLAEAKAAAAKKAAEEAAAKAKAEAEERERLRLENERLQKEKAAAEEAARAEREKHLAEQAAKDEQARKERAEIEAKAKAERDAIEAKARAEREKAEAEARAAKLAQEKAEREARELREAQEAEAKRLRDEQAAKEAAELAAREAAAAAPDREKLEALAAQVRAIVMPEMSSEAGKSSMTVVRGQFEKMAAWLDQRAASLGTNGGKVS